MDQKLVGPRSDRGSPFVIGVQHRGSPQLVKLLPEGAPHGGRWGCPAPAAGSTSTLSAGSGGRAAAVYLPAVSVGFAEVAIHTERITLSTEANRWPTLQ